MLDPQCVGVRRALCDEMRALHVGIELPLGRHELGAETAARDVPRSPFIARTPHTTTRHAHEHVTRIAWIDAHRMDSGMIRAAAEPLLAPRVVPRRTVQLPRISIIVRLEEPARQRAAPDDTRLIAAARRQRPYQ